MKSFFKKLSFVMALAMVVSLVAPAGSAFAAEEGIALQETKEVVTEYSVGVGEEVVDFCFVGAPADWKTTYKWTSSKEDIATVDKAGKVTTLKDGVTEITITAGADGAYKHTVVLTVGKGDKADNSFEVKQTTYTLAELTFANKEITQAEVEAGLQVFWYVTDDYKATQPFQVVSVKDGVAKINVYGFNDSIKYLFKYEDCEVDLLATIGDVAKIELKAFADSACTPELEHIAYVGKDATIKYTLYNAQGVDITDVALSGNTGAYVEYQLVKESTNGEYWLNDMTGTTTSPEGKIYFTAAGKPVLVTAKYVTGKYDDKTGLPVEGPKANPYPITSTNAPAYRITNKVATTIANTPDWNNTTTIIALEDESETNKQYVVFKFKDSESQNVVTKPAANAKGTFTFKSTNPAVAFVNPSDGEITTNQSGQTTVLVYFTPAATTAVPNPTAVLVGAETITVREKRAVFEIVVPAASRAVVVSSADENEFNKAEFTVTVKDQLGSTINSNDIKVERNKATLPTGVNAPSVTIASTGTKGEYKVSIVANSSNLPSGSTSYPFTYEVKATGAATQTFTITVRQPIYTDSNVLVVSGHEIVTNNVTDIKTTNNAAKTLTASVYVQSNAVNVFAQSVEKNPGRDYIAGKYYYSVTKNGTDITASTTLNASGTAINIGLTSVDTVTASGSAVNGLKVVNKANSGAGNYVITVYKAVGATDNTVTQALSTVQTKTVTVTDTQKTVAFVTKTKAEVTAADIRTLVVNAFKFNYNGTTFGDGAALPSNIKMDVNAKVPTTGIASGAVVFVKTVDFYVETGTGTGVYTKNTVTINDYITIK